MHEHVKAANIDGAECKDLQCAVIQDEMGACQHVEDSPATALPILSGNQTYVMLGRKCVYEIVITMIREGSSLLHCFCLPRRQI